MRPLRGDDRARGARPRPRAGRGGRRAGRARRREHAFGCDLLVVSGGSAPGDLAADPVRRAAPPTTASAAASCSRELPDDVYAAGEVAGAGDARGRRAVRRHRRAEAAAAALGFGDAARATRRRSAGRSRRGSRRRRRAAPGDQRAQGQVLRLPVRGRDREGHPPVGRGGLRLDRAVQALHDHDDGPLPGPHVPAAGGAADGPGDRPEPRAGRHHDRAAALARRADGRARRAGPSSPPSARRSTAATASWAPP